MADGSSDAEGRGDDSRGDEGRGDQGDGDRPARSRGRDRPGPEDDFWVVVLGLIVVVLFLVGLLSWLGTDAGTANRDWNGGGWH